MNSSAIVGQFASPEDAQKVATELSQLIAMILDFIRSEPTKCYLQGKQLLPIEYSLAQKYDIKWGNTVFGILTDLVVTSMDNYTLLVNTQLDDQHPLQPFAALMN